MNSNKIVAIKIGEVIKAQLKLIVLTAAIKTRQ